MLLVDCVDCDDVLVADRGGGAGLAEEPAPRAIVVGQVGADEFDRYHPVELRVKALEHDPHPAAAQDAEDLVMCDPAEAVRPRGRGEEREVRRVLAAGRQRCRLSRDSVGQGRRVLGVRDRLGGIARGP